MPATTEWYIEDRVLLSTVDVELIVDELIETNRIITQYIVQHSNTIHLIIDVSQLKKFPTNIMPVRESTKAYLTSDSMGYLIIVGINNPILRLLTDVVAQLSKTNWKQVRTMKDAIKTLNDVDPDLPTPD